MQIFWLILILSVFTVSCGNDPHKENKTEDPSKETTHGHDGAKEKLELNNGVKWKADSSTNNNVRNLQTIVEKFKNSPYKSLDGYISTATELQAGIDKMIAECKMSGPDHDALHKWLLPLINEISKLNKSGTEIEAIDHMNKINERLTMYSGYFE